MKATPEAGPPAEPVPPSTQAAEGPAGGAPSAGSYDTARIGLAFLAAATRTLASAVDVEGTVARVARLSLPHLGSWCVVDLREGDQMRRLAVIHPDPARQRMADRLLAGWPPQRDAPAGVPPVVPTRRSEVVFPVTDEVLAAFARSRENVGILRALGIGSMMIVPLLARDEVLGAITYVSPNHGDSFTPQDLVLAEELAARCAVSIDNARLLGGARRARAEAQAAREQARDAGLAKMRFLSTMSHEFRTPLNAIGGFADLLEAGVHGALNEAQLADVARIQANRRHLLELVESVLGYARASAEKVGIDLQDVPLAAVLVEAGTIIAPRAREKGIACHGLDADAGRGPWVHANREKLLQVLLNLLANAVQFTPEQGRVDVTLRAEGPRVEIRVADDGIGIAPEHHRRIFEPFAQVDETLTRPAEGTGLGLAISRELAVAMGGGLSVESEPGRGSTFTLTLPGGAGEGRAPAASAPGPA
jgi:signal transduction histidine kinase